MQKKSAIGHRTLPFNCPHSDDDIDSITKVLNLPSPCRILDIGCGRGELLCRMVERASSAHGVGVDINETMLQGCRKPVKGTVEMVQMDMESWMDGNTDKYDLIICVGSLREEKQAAMIKDLSQRLNPTGYLLIGELVWVNKPSDLFLDFLQIKESCYMTSVVLRGCIEMEGCRVHHHSEKSLETYETNILHNIEEWARDNADDADKETITTKARSWHDFSSKNAWNTWQFATVLAQKV